MTEQNKPLGGKELRECYFCHCEGRHVMIIPTEDEEGYHAYCPQCGCTGPVKDTYDDAFDAWNTRPSGWIPVSERLPEESGVYETTCDHSTYDEAHPYRVVHQKYFANSKTWAEGSRTMAWRKRTIDPYTPPAMEGRNE